MLTSCFDQILASIAYWIPLNLLLYRQQCLCLQYMVVHDLSFCMYAIAMQALCSRYRLLRFVAYGLLPTFSGLT